MVWVKPSIGIWFGFGTANKDNSENENSGNAGIVLGEWLIQLGILLGSIVGIGKRFGLYTGLLGAFALIPLFGLGFIGIPIGVHYERKIGIGLIFPVFITQWWIAVLVGIILFLIGIKLDSKSDE